MRNSECNTIISTKRSIKRAKHHSTLLLNKTNRCIDSYYSTMNGSTRLIILTPVFLGLIIVPVLFLLRDPTPYYNFRRSEIVFISEDDPEIIDGHIVQTVAIESGSGLKVDIALKIPLPDNQEGELENTEIESPVRRPAALILGGFETGRDAVNLIGDTRGVVTAALSYPYTGDQRPKGFDVVKQIPAARRAIFDTPPAAQLALDYLAARPDVDPDQIELIGVSLGALFVPTIGARDERPHRVWSLHGAGAPYTLLEFNLRPYIESSILRHSATTVLNILMSGPKIAPEKWVSQIAPRPFIMINARDDERIPRKAIEVLYDAASEPRELIWTDGKHVMGGRVEIIQELIDLVLNRIGHGIRINTNTDRPKS